MSRRLLVLALLLGGCAPSPDATLTAAHREAIVDSVIAMLDRFRAAVGSLDPDSVARFYVADSTFRWIEDGAIRYRHRDEITAALRDMATRVTATRLLYDGTVITPLAPGVAAVSTGFAQQITLADGHAGGFAGAVSAVVVHRADGWQFLSGHTSSAGRDAREAQPPT